MPMHSTIAIYSLSPEPAAADSLGGAADAAPSRDGESDEWLLQSCGRGDAAALERFYRRNADRLYSVAVRLLFSTEDAQDVLQEAFLKIWEKASTYDPRLSSALGWCVMQVRSLCIDRMRKVHRHTGKLERLRSFDSWRPPAAEDTAQPAAELAEQIQSAMALLPEAERRCVALAVFSEMTHAEVAETLGQPLGTIKSRLWRGMNKLRNVLRNSHD